MYIFEEEGYYLPLKILELRILKSLLYIKFALNIHNEIGLKIEYLSVLFSLIKYRFNNMHISAYGANIMFRNKIVPNCVIHNPYIRNIEISASA